MKFDNALLDFIVTYKLEEVKPLLGKLAWIATDDDSSVDVFVGYHEVSANATDEAVTLDEDTNTKVTFLIDADNGSALTVKVNGSSVSKAVKPLLIRSKALTSLSVSNSTADIKRLIIARIVTKGSNISFKEM